MKNVFLCSIVVLGLVLLAACSKSDSTPAPSQYFMKAIINNVAFLGNYATTDASTALWDINGYADKKAAYATISIAVTNPAVGTYAIDGFNSVASIDSTAASSVSAAYGSVTVALITDTTVSGTFSFTCTDSTRVTSGSFTARRTN